MHDFLQMGGYARFVWPAYALALLVIAWNLWSATRLGRAARTRALRQAEIHKDRSGSESPVLSRETP
jgi:heme exporter protein CcmD